MTMLELPHVNILSKIDLIRALGKLDFNLDYYLRSAELEQLPRLMRVKEGLGSGSDSAEEERGAGTDDDDADDGERPQNAAGRAPHAINTGPQHDSSAPGTPSNARPSDGKGQIRDAQRKWRKLEQAIAGLITSYDLVHFIPLSIKDKDTVAHACRFIDKSNGYLYSGLKGQVDGDTAGLGVHSVSLSVASLRCSLSAFLCDCVSVPLCFFASCFVVSVLHTLSLPPFSASSGAKYMHCVKGGHIRKALVGSGARIASTQTSPQPQRCRQRDE